jgi:hypothetical protein
LGGHAPMGFLNPALYAIGKSNANYASIFHDITTGNNFSSSSPDKYSAVPGYDLCTGWGTPNGTNLINTLTPLVFVPQVVAAGSALVAEGCLPTNGVIDSGETVTVNFDLQNIGSINTTNLVATLLATNGVGLPSGPQNYGALAAGGASVSRPFSFTALNPCGSNITATFQLQDGATNLGTVTFNFSLGGLAVGYVENFEEVFTPTLPGDDQCGVRFGAECRLYLCGCEHRFQRPGHGQYPINRWFAGAAQLPQQLQPRSQDFRYHHRIRRGRFGNQNRIGFLRRHPRGGGKFHRGRLQPHYQFVLRQSVARAPGVEWKFERLYFHDR